MTTFTRITKAALSAAVALGVLAASAPASAEAPPAAAGTISHGFLFDDGVVTTIDHPDANTILDTPDDQAGTLTSGINDRGDVLGAYERQDRVVPHFVRDRKGCYELLDAPPGVSGVGLTYEPVDLNNRGEIVGFYNDDEGNTTTGFLRTRNGRFKPIEVPDSQVTGPLKINDRRQVVGIYVDEGGKVHGFVWDDGEYATIDVPDGVATIVAGVNNRGQMVGSYIDADGAYHGFRRDKRGAVTTLPQAPGADPMMGGTSPASINDHGQIVGGAIDPQGGSRGFLFEDGTFTMFDGTAGAAYTRALDINNLGQIVGDYGTKPVARALP